MALYAAYGSNMDPAQMLLRCPHSPQRGTGWLEGWRLSFGGEELGWGRVLEQLTALQDEDGEDRYRPSVLLKRIVRDGARPW